MKTQVLCLSVLIFLGCQENSVEQPKTEVHVCENSIIENGFYYQTNNEQMLWAGEDTITHFNVTGWTLDPCKLRFGFGREYIQALIEPEFEPLSDVSDKYSTDHKSIVVKDGNDVKVFPYDVLYEHELINLETESGPVIVVLCYLADLAAVYESSFCGEKLTFAVTGWTYHDPEIFGGLESFVLWDRDTESLWWPILDKGVSGSFKDRKMIKMQQDLWEEISWSEVKSKYPDALVIKSNQIQEPPEYWQRKEVCAGDFDDFDDSDIRTED